MTNNEFASRVINSIRALSKDMHISKRYAISIGKKKAQFLMSQKLDEYTLSREDNIISTIDCFQLEPADTKSCDIFEFRLCHSLMKSCKKLPEGIFGKSGSGIMNVTNMDGTKSYHYITPRQFSLLKNRSTHRRRDVGFYTIQNGHLYLPESRNELVVLQMITTDTWEAENCSECKKEANCKSKLDATFVCPDRFIDLVISETIRELATVYRTTPVDENPNLDENIKTQTEK